MVYFIKDEEHIKIGYATNPKTRISDLQVGNPRKLECLLLIDGGHKTEKELHVLFSEEKNDNSGEWFDLTEPILKFIEEHKGEDKRREYGILPRLEWDDNEGSQIRKIRRKKGMSLKQLAEEMGIAPVTLHEAETREPKGRITLAKLSHYASALGHKLEYRLVELDDKV